MQQAEQTQSLLQIMTALILAATLLLSALFLANRVQESSVYQQSRVVGSIMAQESVGLGELLQDTDNIGVMLKFVGAVASAYINFELIPVNEANTFAAVFGSLEEDIRINTFQYQRRNLVIEGTTNRSDTYERFIANLRRQNYFDSVSGDYYISTDDTVKFKIICVSSVPAYQANDRAV